MKDIKAAFDSAKFDVESCAAYGKGYNDGIDFAMSKLSALLPADTEPLTDTEQRIFLAAMSREKTVCKLVDEEGPREPYEKSLVKTCNEIIRKVKGALWT